MFYEELRKAQRLFIFAVMRSCLFGFEKHETIFPPRKN